MPLLNLIPIKRFRTAEFLDCIDLYGNEPIVVTKGGIPYLVGFPERLALEFREHVACEKEEVAVTKGDIRDSRVFNGAHDEHGRIFVLVGTGGKRLYAFVRYAHFTTYPAVMWLFREGKPFDDYLWDYPKPYVPPKQAKLTMTARFLERGLYDLVDREFFWKEKEAVYGKIGRMRLPDDERRRIEEDLRSLG